MRTCVLMMYTDGREQHYAALRGHMLNPHTFDAHSASIVARVATHLKPTAELYADLCRRFATADAPPVPWQDTGARNG